MKTNTLRLFIWTFIFFSSNSLLAQHHTERARKIFHSGLSQQEKIDSLYQWSFRRYPKDYVFFQQLSDTLLILSEKADYRLGKVKSHLLLALIANGQGKLEELQFHSQKALQHLPKNSVSSEMAWIIYCQGSYYRRKKRDKEALESFYKGLKTAQQLGDKSAEAIFNTSLGIMHVGRQEYKKALAYYDRTLELAKLTNDSNRIQRTFTNKGIVYQRQQKYAQAIQSHLQALKMAKALNNEADEAFTYNDLGATYIQIDNQLPTAINYLNNAISLREKLKENAELAYSYGYLGQAYGKMGNQAQAVGSLKKALAIAISIGNNKQHYEALEELATQYKHFKQSDSAYLYLRQYISFRDSLRKAEELDAIAELTVKHDTEKKEQEIKLLTQKNKIQQLGISQRNLYLSITLLLVISALATLWLLYRSKKNKELQLKQEAVLQAELLQLETENKLQHDRLRISRELHDNIGANLTFIQTSIDDNITEENGLNEVRELVSETISELRRTVWLINKPAMRIDEWLVKLREYYSKLRKVHMETYVLDTAIILSSKQATLLFRIIQEAINNSLKHASPSKIQLVINGDQSYLEIVINDDGKGFDPNKKLDGFGLDNMRQNTFELGGNLSIESKVDKGTRIKLMIHFPVNTQ